VTYFDKGQAGLVVRVTASGVRSYSCWYRVRGLGARRLTIGRVEEVALADARQRARDIRQAARQGRDLGAEEQAAQAEADAAAAKAALVGDTFSALSEKFLEDGRTRRGAPLAPATLAFYRRVLAHDVLPVLGTIPPPEVTRAHVRAMVDGIRQKGAETAANRALAVTGAVFGWAVSKDMLPVSPVLGLRQTPESARERFYSTQEIKAIISALPGTRLERLVGVVFYTGARSDEARSMRWSDLDLERRVWMVPAPKEGKAKLIPLTREVLDLVAGIERTASPFVFPARTKTGYMDPPDYSEIRERSGVADFTLHPIRDTLRTMLPEHGVPADTCERVLGHSMGKIRKTYDHGDYLVQKRAALETWAQLLKRIVAGAEGGAEVVAFGKRA
jgi:integrase